MVAIINITHYRYRTTTQNFRHNNTRIHIHANTTMRNWSWGTIMDFEALYAGRGRRNPVWSGKEPHWSSRGWIVKSAEHCGANYKPLERYTDIFCWVINANVNYAVINFAHGSQIWQWTYDNHLNIFFREWNMVPLSGEGLLHSKGWCNAGSVATTL